MIFGETKRVNVLNYFQGELDALNSAAESINKLENEIQV